MVVQFFKGGRTKQGAKSAVGYLLNQRMEQGTAKVYQGNPDLTLKIISQINRKWKFTSGVISFEEPYDKVKDILPKIKEEFEKTFFPGLSKDQYNILYVLHTDKGRAELHFIVPRIELTTGKDLAIYTHKKDLKKKDLFQRYINSFYDLSNPLDKKKQETLKIEDRKWSNENKEFKKQLHELIEQGVLDGVFSNREEIVSFLKKNGIEVKREGKNYITIINPSNQKSVRLKGEYYDETWSITRTIEKISRREERESLVRLGEKLRERVARDAEANRKKYSKSKSKDIKRDERITGEHRLGVGAVQDKTTLDMGDKWLDNRDNINNNNIQNNDERIENDSVRRKIITRIRTRREIAKRDINQIENFIPRAKQVNNTEYRRDEEIKKENRTTTRDNIQTTATDRKINNIIRGISKYIKSGIKRVRRIIMGNREELERFKTDINIADVAQDMGYEIDKKKSSRKSIVLKSGGDVIIVSRNSNGHYVYFNANNNRDSGTIIDFIQNRTGKNLGQVRKLLRQYLQSSNRIQLEISNTNEIKEYYKTLDKFANLWEEIKKTDTKKEFFRYSEEDIRGISKDTLFKVKNLVFDSEKWLFYLPVFNQNGICGLYTLDKQMKNKSFVKGSIKGIWADRTLDKSITKIIITESPVDSLSAIELKRGDEDEDTTLHIATLGRMGQEAKETLKKVFRYLPNAELIIATDQDQAGEDIAREIAELAREAGLNNVNLLTFKAKDLNEYLQIKKGQEQIYSPSYSPSKFKR